MGLRLQIAELGLLPVFWSTPNGSPLNEYSDSHVILRHFVYRSPFRRTPAEHSSASCTPMNCAAGSCCIPDGTNPPSPERPPRSRTPPAPGTRLATGCGTTRCNRSATGSPPPPESASDPTSFHQFVRASQMNSEPLSLRIRVGDPRRPTTRAMIRRTSAPVIDPAAWSTRHSRVYSSTNVNHLSGRPPAVRS